MKYKNLMGTISQLFPNFKTVPKETECTRTNGNKCRSTQVMKRKVLCRRGADSSTCLFLPLLENDEIGMFTKASKVFFLRVHGIWHQRQENEEASMESNGRIHRLSWKGCEIQNISLRLNGTPIYAEHILQFITLSCKTLIKKLGLTVYSIQRTTWSIWHCRGWCGYLEASSLQGHMKLLKLTSKLIPKKMILKCFSLLFNSSSIFRGIIMKKYYRNTFNFLPDFRFFWLHGLELFLLSQCQWIIP